MTRGITSVLQLWTGGWHGWITPSLVIPREVSSKSSRDVHFLHSQGSEGPKQSPSLQPLLFRNRSILRHSSGACQLAPARCGPEGVVWLLPPLAHRHLLVLEKVVYRLDLKPEAVFCNSFDQINYVKVLWGGIELKFWFCRIIEKNYHPHFKSNSQLYSDPNSESHFGHYFFSWALFLISFLDWFPFFTPICQKAYFYMSCFISFLIQSQL